MRKVVVRMKNWKVISPAEVTKNPFTMFIDDWALLTVKSGDTVNSMTVSWGGVGYFWKKPAATVYVRPQRFTCELLQKADSFSLSFFGKEKNCKEALTIMGRNSGRDMDKYAASGFTVAQRDGVPFVEQADMVFLCRKRYMHLLAEEGIPAADRQAVMEEFYPKGDNHNLVIGEILTILQED